MVRLATYDPGRRRDRFGMLGGHITQTQIRLLNAKEWNRTDFTIAEDNIAQINKEHKFDYHYCESNNQGWHVIDNLRRYHKIPIRPITTTRGVTDPEKIRDSSILDKPKEIEWVEYARIMNIIEFPAKPWSAGIKALDNQLDNFVAKQTSTGVKYEAIDPDIHDDLVMCLIIMARVARTMFLGKNEKSSLGWGVTIDNIYNGDRLNKSLQDKVFKRFRGDMKIDSIN